ncbi:MAG: hypothetical protein JSR86_20205 [Proteobacteria bacterium]|nr:hypothetical protein [Pseudomonadota bacterium]
MSGGDPIVLAVAAPEREWPGAVAGAEMLSESLGEAIGGAPWPVRLNLLAPGAEIPAGPPAPTAVVLSLGDEALRLDEAIAATEARWAARLEALGGLGAPLFVMTVFRHVPDWRGEGAARLERIRALNLMAIRLSNALGVGVVDVDRALAHIGARHAHCDWRLGGVLAAEVTGHTLAWSLLALGLDAVVEPGVQQAAGAALGGLNAINTLVSRRLTRKRAAAHG